MDLVHARISSLSKLNLPRFAGSLQRLCLRQNFVSTLDEEVFHTLTKLVELDLYDNKLKTVGRSLDSLSQLRYVPRYVRRTMNSTCCLQSARSIIQSNKERARCFGSPSVPANCVFRSEQDFENIRTSERYQPDKPGTGWESDTGMPNIAQDISPDSHFLSRKLRIWKRW
jgi:hypothetical protein